MPAIFGGLMLMVMLVLFVRWLVAKARYRALLSNMDWKVMMVLLVRQNVVTFICSCGSIPRSLAIYI